MDKSSIALKALGAIGTGLVLYDAHKAGQINSTASQKFADGDYGDAYINSKMQLSDSTIASKLKEWWFNFTFTSNLSSFFSMIGGYVSGAAGYACDSILPLGLSLGALLVPNKKVAALSLGGLALWGAKHLLYDVFSIGKRNVLDE